MWHLHSNWYDLIIRSFLVFIFIFIFIRQIAKKQLSKLSPFEFSLILIIGISIQMGMIGDDHSLPAVLIIISSLICMNAIMHELTFRYSWFEKLIIGRPEVIILNGKLHKRVLKKEKITEAELFEALREHEVMKTEDVKCAILETDGKISIIKYGIKH